MGVSLRAAGAADSAYCLDVHRRTMRELVERLWGWDEDEQRDFHRRSFDPSRTRLILLEDAPVGVVVVERRPDALFLSRIEVDPAAQGRGVGTWVIRAVQETAAQSGIPVLLEVFLANVRAAALYRRLGFTETRRCGPKREMRWISDR